MERRIRVKRKAVVDKYQQRWSILSSLAFVLFLLFAGAALIIPAWSGWQSYAKIRMADTHIKNIITLEGIYEYRDEARTMSLNMAAMTHDKKWLDRYEELEKRAKPIIEPSWNVPKNGTIGANAILTNLAFDELSEKEKTIHDLIQTKNPSRAAAILKSPEYAEQKEAYANGMKAFVVNTKRMLEEKYNGYWKNMLYSLVAICVFLPVIVISWLIFNRAGKYLCQRAEAKRKGVFGKEWYDTFNAITDGVSIIDIEEGKILQCNKALTRFMQKPQSELIGQNCCELLHGTTESIRKCPFAKMKNTKRSEETEFRIGDKWLNIKVDPLLDDSGNLIGAVHIISDITKNRSTNKALKETENKFRLTFVNAQDAIIWIDAESGNITNCNRASEHMFGKTKKEFVGQHYTILYPDDKRSIYGNLFTKSDTDINSIIEGEILANNNELRQVTIAASTMQVDGNEVIQIIIRDITENKKAVEEAKSLAKFPSEDPNPVLRISIEGKILYANDASLPVLKTWGTQTDQNLPAVWSGRIAEVYNSGNSDTLELNCEDDQSFIITLQPITGAGYVNAYGLDITSHKKAEKEKMDLELQLSQKQKMEAIGTLAGGIAHDFNNILSAMQGYTELTLDDLPEDSPFRDNLEQILACSNRATKLVKQILTFSRKDEQEREKEPTQISAIIKEVLGMLRSSLPTTIKICRKINAESSKVFADPTQIHQILVNLCTNASHAMGQQGGTLEVALADVTFESQTRIGDEHLDEGEYVKLSISDTGSGMEPEVMKRIFEPFFTTKKLNEGTGLGLPVVHGIVKSHGGAINVESTPGQGTTFDIYLPKIIDNENSELSSTEETKKDKKLILLVDDEEMMVDVTGRILERIGFEVIAKTNSLDALEEFQERPEEFDLVITDQVMPNMTGTQLASELLAIRSDVPIILCSGFPEKISSEELQAIGIKQFIMKPISKQVISTIVMEALNKEIISI